MRQNRPMHQWLRILEKIRDCRGLSKNYFETNEIMPRSQFSRLLKAKRGPRIDTIERLLKGMGASWKDWAEASESLPGDRGNEHQAEPVDTKKRAS